jgi:Fe-S-cluster containining protein
MRAAPQASQELVRAQVTLSGPDWEIRTAMSVPAGPTRLVELLPLARSFADAVMSSAAKLVAEQGKQISCRKGCGACCRQLVPIAEVEARHIGHLVNGLQEPRRTEVRGRFAEARRRLEEAGLLEKLLHPERWDAGERQSLGLAYFRQGIPCPFLEEEACSIYADRPIACREYLVTSPAENCARPTPETVEKVKPPLQVWTALARLDRTIPSAHFVRWVPLILAPEWFETHPQETPPRLGPELLRELFDHLTGTGGPLAGPPGTPGDEAPPEASVRQPVLEEA